MVNFSKNPCMKNLNVLLVTVRPVPFYDLTLFVVLSLFTGGSPNSGRKYSDCVAGSGREKREDNKERKIIK